MMIVTGQGDRLTAFAFLKECLDSDASLSKGTLWKVAADKVKTAKKMAIMAMSFLFIIFPLFPEA